MSKAALPPESDLASDLESAEAPAVRPRERRQRVQAAETGMSVLKGLARLGGRASLTALATHVGESPAKVHRYLMSLVAEGLVDQEVATQQYHLGLEALYVGVAAMRQADPLRIGEPALVRLRESLAVTCFIAVMGNKGPTIVRFEEPGLPVTVNVRVGSVLSMLWSATGRAFLGLLDEAPVRALAEAELASAPSEQRALLDRDDPIGVLRRDVRTLGCATVKDTNLRGISAVSAPLYDHTGRVCAVLTALGATGGFDVSESGAVVAAVKREALAASVALGYVAG
ncbi:IclR family transcriptional regulator [Achromobacter mucicolens]|uniref:IclR family transcriptional regulator n=1 Tax=Achromobacter mucicolens TaxID=1389922 RepID=UPI0021D29F37|nr:IclR family transcriptional regulator [Achromobacter mucicolens]MCU6615628.1 IclR family transcriptional regulator [Achromobacter mucicolens]